MITISAVAEGQTHVRVVIADNGGGMSEAALGDCVMLFSSGKPGGMGSACRRPAPITELPTRCLRPPPSSVQRAVWEIFQLESQGA